MKLASWAVVGLTALVCVAALVKSVVPGELNALVPVIVLFGIPVAAVAIYTVIASSVALAVIVVQCGGASLARDVRGLHGLRTPALAAGVCVALLGGTWVLLKLYVPRRIAFLAAQYEFEELAVAIDRDGRASIGREIGPWRVEDITIDAGGGLYFHVKRHDREFLTNSSTWGFARDADPEGSLFAHEYVDSGIHPLAGRWSWFRVTYHPRTL